MLTIAGNQSDRVFALYHPFHLIFHALEAKDRTYVCAFLTSEGSSWCGRSVTTEGLRPE